ncbi:brain protein I3-like [Penaeus monodon]|uniref:brain protein I3-like n=1 Tax=Penaeus monodon TaxID=6687 RepID=UPI0018A763CB|nr:brain protein I3-like [Penaeus monodon]
MPPRHPSAASSGSRDAVPFPVSTEKVQPAYDSDTRLDPYSSGVQYQATTMQYTTVSPVVVACATCPICKAGFIQQEFPLGLLCCFLVKRIRCSNCGKEF